MKEGAIMKIVSVDVMRLKTEGAGPVRPIVCRIHTDTGLYGVGEAGVAIVSGAMAAYELLKDYARVIIGMDPLHHEVIWEKLYKDTFWAQGNGPIIMAAISAIDTALWDIKGKALNTPIYNLLGGKCRDRLKVYCWIGGDRPSDIAAEVLKKQREGYSAVKMNASEEMHYIDSFKKIDAVLSRARAIREAVGMNMEFAIDFHGRIHKSMAKALAKELEPYHPMFIEEPVLSENIEALRDIANATSTPIATGERMFSRWDFKKILTEGYVDIIQPDLSHAGGISECRKIAAMAGLCLLYTSPSPRDS